MALLVRHLDPSPVKLPFQLESAAAGMQVMLVTAREPENPFPVMVWTDRETRSLVLWVNGDHPDHLEQAWHYVNRWLCEGPAAALMPPPGSVPFGPVTLDDGSGLLQQVLFNATYRRN